MPGDPWHPYYDVPGWLKKLIEQGALGQKSRRGVYQKVGNDIHVLDVGSGSYRLSEGRADDKVVEILKNQECRRALWRASRERASAGAVPVGGVRDVFHYCAVHLAEIAHNARDLDLAIRWGFGWDRGPFEIWQEAGWQRVAGWIAEDIASGKAMAAVPLAAWARARPNRRAHSRRLIFT